MIDLHYWPTPNGWKITIMLEECGLDYAVKLVRIGRGDQFKPDFLAISPNGRMPAIVDYDPAEGGAPLSIFESGAILLYLAEKTGRLLPKDVAGRSRTLQWLMWQMSGLGPMAGQNGHFLLYAPEKIPYAIERYGRETRRLYEVLDRQLATTGNYVTGAYSIADIACFPWIMTHKRQSLTLDDLPHLKEWFATVRQRPAVQKGLAVCKNLMAGTLDDRARAALFEPKSSAAGVPSGE